jgi:hypothetical protein
MYDEKEWIWKKSALAWKDWVKPRKICSSVEILIGNFQTASQRIGTVFLLHTSKKEASRRAVMPWHAVSRTTAMSVAPVTMQKIVLRTE